MLEVYPIQEKKEQEELCKLCGIKYDADKLAYKGVYDGKLKGVLQFGIKGSCGYVYDLENVIGENDHEMLFVMGRAALNFIDMCGVCENYFMARSEGREDLVRRIGYSLKDGKWYMDTTDFFTGHCHCES